MAFVMMLFSIGYDILSPLLVGQIEELVKAEFELPALWSRVAVYAGILAVSLVCTYAQAMILQKTGQKILSAMRQDIFTHIESLSHEQLNSIPVGKLVTRVANDPNAISYMFTNILVTLAKNVMVILGVLGAMLMINGRHGGERRPNRVLMPVRTIDTKSTPESCHLRAPLSPWQCCAPAHGTLPRPLSFSLARTKNPSRIFRLYRRQIV